MENGGVITEAISSQVWSGDAAVHVSIVNWEKGEKASPGIPGGALDPSAISGDPPETPVSARAPEDVPSGDVAGVSASSQSFRRVAEKSTRVECSTQSSPTCRLTFQRGDSVDSP